MSAPARPSAAPPIGLELAFVILAVCAVLSQWFVRRSAGGRKPAQSDSSHKHARIPARCRQPMRQAIAYAAAQIKL